MNIDYIFALSNQLKQNKMTNKKTLNKEINNKKLSPKISEMVGFKKFDIIYEYYDEKDLHESEKKNFSNDGLQSVFLDEDKNSVAILLENEYSCILPKGYKNKIKNINLKQIAEGSWLTGDKKLDEILDEAIIVLSKTNDGLRTTTGYKVYLSNKK